ncbi:hypothetical protein NEOLEDRAFT_1147583 [Neolentinus lepideus HHB14362 ss-1]|uniref:DDE Tnp4 domain-containing protein n=1 Tax=Neolentinus lepideus HHB14362 ss-1 TaxID=1314782 RepID=A0A165SXI7_9AGAM|nr:hypothetical protein NEOLEDRAFT_1147583 [Neolentinus lepideus HHB14362 ss-1]
MSSAEGLSSTNSMPGLASVVDSESEVDFEMVSSSSSSDLGMWEDDEMDGGEVSGDSSDLEGEEGLRVPGGCPSRMGRNAAGLQNVANWAGVAKGTVLLATRHVMIAILCPGFMKEAMHYPTLAEKEAAKHWAVSLPNLLIIDFGYGFTGSTHNSTAWEGTRIAQEAEDVFEGEEFIWADSAYPVHATA